MEGNDAQRFGAILQHHRDTRGWTIPEMSARMDVRPRTLSGWLAGEYLPTPKARPRVEQALGLRVGAITSLLRDPDLGLEDVAAVPPARPATRAADLTDDELMVEVMHRLRDWRDWTRQREAAPEEAVRSEFDLAAHDDDHWAHESAGAPED
jgi:transcriptional regulator with XRE-family HTH domain